LLQKVQTTAYEELPLSALETSSPLTVDVFYERLPTKFSVHCVF